MWKAKKVASTAAQNIQVDAGLLLNNFDVANPVDPADADIVCATTGDFSISATPEVEDFFEDVNNAPTNTMEGKRITGWTCELSVNCLEITEETLALALGASKSTVSNGGVTPRDQYKLTDFKKLFWIGDMVDEDKLFVVAMDNTVSTGGLSFTATNNGKGQLALTLTPHTSLQDVTKIPMEFYVLEKVDAEASYTYSAVTPVGTENPHEEGWYVLHGDTYSLTTDTTVDTNKTYYERVEGA